MEWLIYIRYCAWHYSNAILLANTLLREFVFQQVQMTSESEWRYKEKVLICSLISLRVIKRPTTLMVNSCCSYTKSGHSSTVIALIPSDGYHQEE